MQTIGYGRELTRELKFVGIRGRFAWGIEATPLFAQFSPSTIYGVGIAPVVWRWNFPPRPTLVGVRGAVDGRDVDERCRFPRTPAA